jgi:PAS domain S-box-containing protein
MKPDPSEKSMLGEIHLRQILDGMIEGVQIIGFDYQHLYVNDAIEKQSNFTKAELIGYTMMERYPGIEQSAVFKVLKACMDTRTPKQIEIDFEFPDKRKAWFELSIQPVEEGIFVLSLDITARKRAEDEINKSNLLLEEKVKERTAELELKIKQLHESQEHIQTLNKELEAFSYSVSHDLRAPLRSIIGFSAILEEDLANDITERNRKTLDTIKSNASRMGVLIDELLAFSKLGKQELALTSVDMETLVHRCVSALQPGHVSVTINSLPLALADSGMIYQVWANLISNAFKYSSKVSQPVIEIGSVDKENQIVFYVRDNGTGFDMKYANKLFGVFQRLHNQRDFEGTGVGLSIVKRIINRHNGLVWADAKPGAGATFYFSLPSAGLKNSIS